MSRYGNYDNVEYATCGTVMWANGDSVTLPDINTSGVGKWYLKSPEANPKPNAKSFGLGYHGKDAATIWMKDRLTVALDAHGWAIPARIEKALSLENRRYSHRPAMFVTYPTEPFGDVSLGFEFQQYAWKEDDKYAVTFTVDYHALAAMLVTKQIKPWINQLVLSGKIDIATSDLPAAISKWVKDPWKHTFHWLEEAYQDSGNRSLNYSDIAVGHVPKLAKLLKPTVPIGNLKFIDQPCEREDGVRWASFRGADLFVGGIDRVKHVVFENLDTIRRVTEAFEHLNVNFDVTTEYWQGDNAITGLTIETAADAQRGSRHPHEIVFHKDVGVSVTCGYEEDEDKWIDYQKRHAAEVLTEIASDDLFEGLEFTEE